MHSIRYPRKHYQESKDYRAQARSGALTLGLATRMAGLSKGGLLYHFPSNDALIAGMIEYALETFESDVDLQAVFEPPGQERWLREYVNVTFAAHQEYDPGTSVRPSAAVNPGLLELVNRYFELCYAMAIADGCHPVTSTIVRLASDGLWFANMFSDTSHVERNGNCFSAGC